MNAFKICEPHTAVGRIHGAFAVVLPPGFARQISVCKPYLDGWLDRADDGFLVEPIGLWFLSEPEGFSEWCLRERSGLTMSTYCPLCRAGIPHDTCQETQGGPRP